MKLSGLASLWVILYILYLGIAHAGIKTERKHLELTTSEGAEILIGYTFENFNADGISAQDVHIEEILINANGLMEETKKNNGLDVYFDDTPVRLKCKGQICHLRATAKNFRSSLFTKNIYLKRLERLKRGSKVVRKTGLRASFKIINGSWLTNLDGEEHFSLTHKLKDL